ncbi:hypothetical protein Gotur_019274, partial [Gossypium turneri]
MMVSYQKLQNRLTRWDIEANLSPQFTPIEWEDKSNKNWCVEVDNSKDNSEMKGPNNLIRAHHLCHKKSSWRRLVNRHESDSNMSEITIGKRKFNQESAEGPEPYSYVEDVTKRVKFDDGNSEAFTIVEALRPITKEDVGSSQTLLVAAKWLQHTLKLYKPQLVFLIETKLDRNRMESVQKRCGFHNGLDISANGSRGGLNLAWNGNHLIQVYSYSNNHIDVEINEEDNSTKWRFTGFYGNPRQSNKQESWNLLRKLRNTCSLSCCVCGDFNEIMYAHEKIRGATKDKRQMEEFRKALGDCALTDMGFCGQKFTSKRGNFVETNIKERLKKEWKIWSGENIKGERERRSKNLQERLVELDGMARDDNTFAEIIDVKLELNWETEKEEMYWEQ